MVLLAYIPMFMILDKYPLNISFCIAFAFSFYYLLLEPMAAALFAPIILILVYSANMLVMKSSNAWKTALVGQIVGWVTQIIGHLVFERRMPALLDSFAQSLVMAPFFVFIELLFLLGYKPAMQKRLNDKIKTAIGTWKLSKERRTIPNKDF